MSSFTDLASYVSDIAKEGLEKIYGTAAENEVIGPKIREIEQRQQQRRNEVAPPTAASYMTTMDQSDMGVSNIEPAKKEEKREEKEGIEKQAEDFQNGLMEVRKNIDPFFILLNSAQESAKPTGNGGGTNAGYPNNGFHGYVLNDNVKSQYDENSEPFDLSMDDIVMNGGPLDIGSWPIFKPTKREEFEAQERADYRNEHPIPEGALVYRMPDGSEVPVTNSNVQGVSIPLTTDEWKQKYYDFFSSLGGVDEDYVTADRDMSQLMSNVADFNAAVESGDFDTASRALTADGYDLGSVVDKLSKENYNDVDRLTWDSVKSKNISGPAYKRLVEAGFGGRPIADIRDDMTYDQLTEMREYGLVPFIEDEDQARSWDLLAGPEAVSNAFNLFKNIRSREWQPTATYNDQTINLDEFDKYSNRWFLDDSDLERFWQVENPITGDVDQFVDNEQPVQSHTVNANGGLASIVFDFPESGKHYEFPISTNDDIDKVDDWLQNGISYRDRRKGFSYTQSDGNEVNFSSEDDVMNFAKGLKDGDITRDYGPANLAKDPDYRKDFGQMLSTLDFNDLAPATLDVLLGSAPLFFNQTAWPMSLSNAVVAAEGLDPQVYDSSELARRRLSQDMDADKYVTNIALNALVPSTERIAGFIGGGHGALGNLVQKQLEQRGVNPLARWGVDVAGEGVEEIVAGLWEDAMTGGWKNWYANPVYETDDNGNIVTRMNYVTGEEEPVVKSDSTGHEVRDPNTPLPDRARNLLAPAVENALAGSWLGVLLGLPKIGLDRFSNTGYYDPAYLENAFENANARKMGKAEDVIQFSPEFFEERRRRLEEEE